MQAFFSFLLPILLITTGKTSNQIKLRIGVRGLAGVSNDQILEDEIVNVNPK